MKTLLVRADASCLMGTGHVMRCLALAQAWQVTGGHVIFVMTTEVPALETRLRAEGVEIVKLRTEQGSIDDVAQTASLARQKAAQWVIVDGYRFGAEYQEHLKHAGFQVLFVDDYGHARHYYADLVLNQNIYADERSYAHREAYTRLLLGTRYALLRREFWAWHGWQRRVRISAHNVLVTMGGSDPLNVTLKAVQALQHIDTGRIEVVIVSGASNPHLDQLQSSIQGWRFPAHLVINTSDMPALMAWADVCISAAGSTCWEVVFMGLPSLLITVADNQQAIAQSLHLAGLAVNAGWHENVSSEQIAQEVQALMRDCGRRAAIADCARRLVDGKGAERTITAWLKGSGGSNAGALSGK